MNTQPMYNNMYPNMYGYNTQPYGQLNNYPYQGQVPQQMSVPQRKLDFIQGKAAAEIYNVDAGQEVILVDMDNPCVYRKARGLDNKLEPMETYNLVLNDNSNEPSNVDLSKYLTSEEFENRITTEIEKRIKDEVDKRISEISFTPTTSKKLPRKKESEV